MYICIFIWSSPEPPPLPLMVKVCWDAEATCKDLYIRGQSLQFIMTVKGLDCGLANGVVPFSWYILTNKSFTKTW